MKVMASTIWVFRRILSYSPTRKRWQFMPNKSIAILITSSSPQLVFPSQGGIGCRVAVFLQLIMQGFQADTENFCRPRLVIAGRFDGLQNQPPLGFFHSCAHSQVYGIGILGRGPNGGLTESGWQ